MRIFDPERFRHLPNTIYPQPSSLDTHFPFKDSPVTAANGGIIRLLRLSLCAAPVAFIGVVGRLRCMLHSATHKGSGFSDELRVRRTYICSVRLRNCPLCLTTHSVNENASGRFVRKGLEGLDDLCEGNYKGLDDLCEGDHKGIYIHIIWVSVIPASSGAGKTCLDTLRDCVGAQQNAQ